MKVISKGWTDTNRISEGKNIIVVDASLMDEKPAQANLDYIDKKYDEGWEIVSHNDNHYTLHKKHRSAKETRGRPRI